MSFTSTPTNKTANETETVTFFCSASGNPTPNITWLRDGNILGTGDTLSFVVNRNQAGEYVCSADNALNLTVNATAYLDVQSTYSIFYYKLTLFRLGCVRFKSLDQWRLGGVV